MRRGRAGSRAHCSAGGDRSPSSDGGASGKLKHRSKKDSSTPANIVFTIDPARSTARYLIREQLASVTSPNDAIGETMDVTGTIALDGEGNVVSEESQIVVGLAGLTSDSSRRDSYVKA